MTGPNQQSPWMLKPLDTHLTPGDIDLWIRWNLQATELAEVDVIREADALAMAEANHNKAQREATLSKDRPRPEKGEASSYRETLKAWVEKECEDTEDLLMIAKLRELAARQRYNRISKQSSLLQTLSRNLAEKRWN